MSESLPGYDRWKTTEPYDPYDDRCEDCGRSYCVCYENCAEPDDDDPLGEWVIDCGDPECCMNFAPHYRHECYTPEMYEAYMAEVEAESKECNCTFGEGANFHLPDCPMRQDPTTPEQPK